MNVYVNQPSPFRLQQFSLTFKILYFDTCTFALYLQKKTEKMMKIYEISPHILTAWHKKDDTVFW